MENNTANRVTEEIINLTPHDIVVMADGEEIARFQSQGVARATMERVETGKMLLGGRVPLYRRKCVGLEGLPQPQENTYYIVSGYVKSECPEREDVICPDTFLRDESGRILGCVDFTL